jgi:arylsulfatase A-like enzyme
MTKIVAGLLLLAANAAAGEPPHNVVLVTIDGVRWQEMVHWTVDVTPNLDAMARSGVMLGQPGAPVSASGPNFVSQPGYREIMTGRPSVGCSTNICPTIDEPTLLDELHLGPDEAFVVASWETIAKVAARDTRVAAISAGRHAGNGRDKLRVSAKASAIIDEAATVCAYPGHFDYRPDRYTAPLALEVLAQKHPRFLHVALGDTDEYAHRNDFTRYTNALEAADAFVGELRAALARMGDYGAATTIIVTTDHGRADRFVDHGRLWPESQRTWLIAAGAGIAQRGAIAAAKPHRLADIAPTLRVLYGLPADHSPIAGSPIDELLAGVSVVASSR